MIGGLLVHTLKDVHFSGAIFNAFTTVFAVSLVLRLLVAMAYLKGFKEVRSVAPSPGVPHFYVYRPAFNMINRFQIANGRFFGQRRTRGNGEASSSDEEIVS
jgi:hypothetical protein